MLSTRLVELIESHREEIATRTIAAVRNHAEMPVLASRPDAELREWCEGILANLGSLLDAGQAEEIRERFEKCGRLRFEESVPLHEAILRLQILKRKIRGLLSEQGFPMTILQLYAEDELDRRMDSCFDAMTYHLVRGYEDARWLETRVQVA